MNTGSSQQASKGQGSQFGLDHDVHPLDGVDTHWSGRLLERCRQTDERSSRRLMKTRRDDGEDHCIQGGGGSSAILLAGSSSAARAA